MRKTHDMTTTAETHKEARTTRMTSQVPLSFLAGIRSIRQVLIPRLHDVCLLSPVF